VSGVKSLNITTKLLLLVAVFGLAFLGFSLLTYHTLQTVKVNGPVYKSIVQGKDLIADILPPPNYIIESYLIVHQLTVETDADTIQRLLEKSRSLRREYDDRHEFWTKDLPEGPIRQTFLVKSYEPAIAFFDLRDREFVPAVRAKDRAKMAEVRDRLKTFYEEHRRAVDDVVRMSIEWNKNQEQRAQEIVASNGSSLFALGIGCIIVVVLIGWVGARFGSSLTRRIALATSTAEKVAGGDLSANLSGNARDETGQLLDALGAMTRNLSSLVVRVKQSSIDILATANEMGTTSKQQESTVQAFGASTNQIAAAVKEISATSQELLNTMNAVSAAAVEAASSAEQGRQGLEGMDSTMRGLSSATGSISSKLSVIREKANDINLVVTTITKVADQTNLLSVNAAIEAEKAGEYGLGFLVLAREIRRLADQTAVATLDIDRMVREMHTAVTAGVMEMDKFSEEVRRGVSGVSQLGGELGRIITRVGSLSERFEAVNEGMRMQSQGAGQIDQAMVQLITGAHQTAGALREFNSATDNLRGAVDGLRQEISQFRVAS
jgi:methyl-accepting chemotaxis protein WspA